MEAGDMLDIGALDAAVAGYGRKEYLDALRREHPDGARVVERGGDIAGYALLRRAPRGWHLGPLVTRAGDAEHARALVRDALARADGAIVALVPDEPAALALWRAEGFREVGSLAHMRAGTAELDSASLPATQWALGGRITG